MNRREFLKAFCCEAGVVSLAGCQGLAGLTHGSSKFKLAMAGYTLYEFDVDSALAFCKKNDVHYLCVKDKHLPFNSTDAQISEFRRKCEDHGVCPYGVGPITMEGSDELRRYFDYAASLGVGLIVGVPAKKMGPTWKDYHSDRKVCEAVSVLVGEYDVKYAIHNHGRNPKTGNPYLYPAVPETYEFIKDLDERVGLCVDWAYTYADGIDCVDVIRTYRNRIFDGHIRCICDSQNGSSGVNPQKRAFDYDAIFNALREVSYDGCLGLELKNAFPENPQWIAESYEYFSGLM